MCNSTADGPRPQFLLPSSALLLVGACTIGPRPQIHSPGLAGERNAVNCRSPMPLLEPMSGPSAGIQMTGRIVRVMMFQSLSTEIGTTGWMFRIFCVPFSGPKLRLVLFWNGRLIRLPTGFCASFASSSALISACTLIAASIAAPNRAAASQRPLFSCVMDQCKSELASSPIASRRLSYQELNLVGEVPVHVVVLSSPFDLAELAGPLLLGSLPDGVLLLVRHRVPFRLRRLSLGLELRGLRLRRRLHIVVLTHALDRAQFSLFFRLRTVLDRLSLLRRQLRPLGLRGIPLGPELSGFLRRQRLHIHLVDEARVVSQRYRCDHGRDRGNSCKQCLHDYLHRRRLQRRERMLNAARIGPWQESFYSRSPAAGTTLWFSKASRSHKMAVSRLVGPR